MYSIDAIIDKFVHDFILKNKRNRALLELKDLKRRPKFTDRFNHCWSLYLDMRYVKQVDKEDDCYDGIKRLTGFTDYEPCYLISDYRDSDNIIIPFVDAFNHLYCRGFASIIIGIASGVFFLDTEQIQGRAPKFIGKR